MDTVKWRVFIIYAIDINYIYIVILINVIEK